MKAMIPIIKKEFRRYFTDKRLLAALILPGISIYILYSLLGGFMGNLFEVSENYEYKVHVVNQSDSMRDLFEAEESLKFIFTDITEDEIENSKELVKNKEIELVIIYDDEFNALLESNGTEFGNVEVYYNYDYTESMMSYSIFTSILTIIKEDMAKPPFGVNLDQDKIYDLVDTESTSSIFAMMIPMLLMMFLISGVLAVAVESVAGEKERGTIASLLITPVSRVHLAFSKIISITVPALLSSLISFIGVVAALPKMMDGTGFTMGKLTFMEYSGLFLTIVFSVLLFSVLLTIISTFAKSIKEAQQLASPLMIVVSMCGVLVMLAPTNIFMYLIPIFNSAMLISSVFSGTFEMIQLLLLIGSNSILIITGVLLISKMFSSESIMFNK